MPDRPTAARPDRLRAEFPPGTVVFMIGMRINSFWRVRSWIPVFMGMPPMIRELFQHPELGLLGSRIEFSWRRVTMMQYWESMEKLMSYSSARDHAHLPAWQSYNRMARRAGGVVGIWHEAYEVNPERSHIVYRHMPDFGIGEATRSVPVGPGTASSDHASEPAGQVHTG